MANMRTVTPDQPHRCRFQSRSSHLPVSIHGSICTCKGLTSIIDYSPHTLKNRDRVFCCAYSDTACPIIPCNEGTGSATDSNFTTAVGLTRGRWSERSVAFGNKKKIQSLFNHRSTYTEVSPLFVLLTFLSLGCSAPLNIPPDYSERQERIFFNSFDPARAHVHRKLSPDPHASPSNGKRSSIGKVVQKIILTSNVR